MLHQHLQSQIQNSLKGAKAQGILKDAFLVILVAMHSFCARICSLFLEGGVGDLDTAFHIKTQEVKVRQCYAIADNILPLL